MVRCCASVSRIRSVNALTTVASRSAASGGGSSGSSDRGAGLRVRGHQQRALVREVAVGRRSARSPAAAAACSTVGAAPVATRSRAAATSAVAGALLLRRSGRSSRTAVDIAVMVLECHHGTLRPMKTDIEVAAMTAVSAARPDRPWCRRGRAPLVLRRRRPHLEGHRARRPAAPSCCSRTAWTAGKMTPLHTHPDSDETMYVLEGEILMHMDGTEHRVAAGGLAVAPRGVPHAFLVLVGRGPPALPAHPGLLPGVLPGTPASRSSDRDGLRAWSTSTGSRPRPHATAASRSSARRHSLPADSALVADGQRLPAARPRARSGRGRRARAGAPARRRPRRAPCAPSRARTRRPAPLPAPTGTARGR